MNILVFVQLFIYTAIACLLKTAEFIIFDNIQYVTANIQFNHQLFST